MRPLNIKRYKQVPAECAVASAASVVNHSNRKVSYEHTRSVCADKVTPLGEGLWSGHTGLLLNMMGFRSVKMITCDLSRYDFSWKDKSTNYKIDAISSMLKSRSIEADVRDDMHSTRNFLRMSDKGFENELVIDFHFADYIRYYLDRKVPLVVSFNWNMYFEYPKDDPIKGHAEEHAVVARGYNKKGIHIVDSHHEYYKRKLKKFRDGYYLMPWEEFLTVMGTGDVIAAYDYDKDLMKA